MKELCTEKILLRLYESLFISRVCYGISVWGGTYATHLKPLAVTQKYCIRVIARKRRIDHSFPIFVRLRQLPLRHLFLYKTLFIFFIKSGQTVPGPRNTRMGSRYVQPRAHKAIFEKSFSFIAARIANVFCSHVPVGNLRSKGTKTIIKNWLLEKTVEELEILICP